MTVSGFVYARNASLEGHATHVINRFVIIVDRLRNANGATKMCVVTVTHLALGVKMARAAVLAVRRRRMIYIIGTKSKACEVSV